MDEPPGASTRRFDIQTVGPGIKLPTFQLVDNLLHLQIKSSLQSLIGSENVPHHPQSQSHFPFTVKNLTCELGPSELSWHAFLYLQSLFWVALFCRLAWHEQQMVIGLWVWSQRATVLPAGRRPRPSEPAPGRRSRQAIRPSSSAEAREPGWARSCHRWRRCCLPARVLQPTTAALKQKYAASGKLEKSD